MATVAHTVRHTAVAGGVRFRGTSVVPGDAGQFGCSFENGERATALAVVAGSAGALGTDRELAGGCVEHPRVKEFQRDVVVKHLPTNSKGQLSSPLRPSPLLLRGEARRGRDERETEREGFEILKRRGRVTVEPQPNKRKRCSGRGYIVVTSYFFKKR